MITGMPAAEFQATAGAGGGERWPGRTWRTCLTGTADAVSGDLLLRQALAVLDTHVTSKATGQCRECGSPGPCWRREPAVAALSRSLRPTLSPAADDGASRQGGAGTSVACLAADRSVQRPGGGSHDTAGP